MSSYDIDIILLGNGFLKVIIYQNENETFQASLNKESTIKSLIEKYEDKIIEEFPKDLLNKLNARNDGNVTNEEDLLINFITGYEENSLALNQKESANKPEIIARPISDPFSIFTFLRKEKTLKVLKFESNVNLEELKDYGPTSAYCNGNNFLFISGGEKSNNELVSKFFKIDLIKAEIETVPMAPKKNHSMIFIQGDYVFIIGGQSKDTFYYDLNENKFYGWGKLNKNRIEPALILVNNYLYCFDNMNNNNSINEKFTFERSDIYSQNHTWEICEPDLSSVRMNQKFFGVSQNNDDIIFIGGNLDLEDEDNINIKERKNQKYNISNNTIEESDIPFINYSFKEKTFLKYNEKINCILPEFNRHQPEVMLYLKEKNIIRFLKGYSKKKLEQKEKAEKNIRDFSPIKMGFKLNLNQPKENENVDNVDININLNPININTNLNNEFNKNENENKNEEIKNLNEEVNNENQNEEYKNQEEEYKNVNEENYNQNEENNEINDQNNIYNEDEVNVDLNINDNNNLGDDINNLINKGQNQDLNIDNVQPNPENENLNQNNEEQNSNKEIENNDALNEKEKEEDTNNLKNLRDNLEYSRQEQEEKVEINIGENQEQINEDVLRGQNNNVDIKFSGNNTLYTNNGNTELDGKGNVQISDVNPINNEPKINIGVSQSNLPQNQNLDLDLMKTFVTNANETQIGGFNRKEVNSNEIDPNNQINQEININGNIPQPSNELNPEINKDINTKENVAQPNEEINPGIDTNINTNNNGVHAEMGTGFGVALPDAGNNMPQEFLLTGIILGTNDNEENYEEMIMKNPELQVIRPGTNLAINNPNVGFNAQVANNNPNINNQQQNLNMPSSNANADIPQNDLNKQGAEININNQQPNLNNQGPEFNSNNQQQNLNMQGPNMNLIGQPKTQFIYNEKGEYVFSGIIVGLEEKDPEIIKYRNNVNMGANLNMNNNMNTDLNAQGGINNNQPQSGINVNENMSGMNPNAPKIDINGNITGGNLNMRKDEINGQNQNLREDNNINLELQSPQTTNNLNHNVNLQGNQGIRIPKVEITDSKVGGNFVGSLNTNIPNNYDPNAPIKPLDIKVEDNIQPINVGNCYDAQGNFYLTGVIPSKNENNINESINNLSMTNLLLLQSNRVDNKLNRSKLGSSNINQSYMNTNQLNTDLNNDNKIEMNVGLNVIKEDEKSKS